MPTRSLRSIGLVPSSKTAKPVRDMITLTFPVIWPDRFWLFGSVDDTVFRPRFSSGRSAPYLLWRWHVGAHHGSDR